MHCDVARDYEKVLSVFMMSFNRHIILPAYYSGAGVTEPSRKQNKLSWNKSGCCIADIAYLGTLVLSKFLRADKLAVHAFVIHYASPNPRF